MKEKKNDRRMQKGSHKETPWRNIYDIQDSYVEDKQLKENKEVLTCLINRDRSESFLKGAWALCSCIFKSVSRLNIPWNHWSGRRGLNAFEWAATVIYFSWCTGRHSSWVQVKVSFYTTESRQQIKCLSLECRRTTFKWIGEHIAKRAFTIEWCPVLTVQV